MSKSEVWIVFDAYCPWDGQWIDWLIGQATLRVAEPDRWEDDDGAVARERKP